MPRPWSRTDKILSFCNVTMIGLVLSGKFGYSSTALSIISRQIVSNPKWSLSPIYIPGRCRIFSKSDKTVIVSLMYILVTELRLFLLHVFHNDLLSVLRCNGRVFTSVSISFLTGCSLLDTYLFAVIGIRHLFVRR